MHEELGCHTLTNPGHPADISTPAGRHVLSGLMETDAVLQDKPGTSSADHAAVCLVFAAR
jgi:hypothetical protein